MEDVDDLQSSDFKWSLFEALRATTKRAAHILETEGDGNPAPPPRKREGAGGGDNERPPPPAPKKLRVIRNPPPPVILRRHPPLPEAFEAAIRRVAGGRAVTAPAKLVIQKCLYPTDLVGNNNRLSIPFNQILNRDFLTAEEGRHLDSYDETKKNNKNYMKVKMVGASPEMETVVKLARWDMLKKKGKTSSSYVINGKWRDVVKKSRLKPEMEVQLWSFRVERDLCFAFVILPGN